MDKTFYLYLAGWLVFVFGWPWLFGAGGGRRAAHGWYGKLNKSALYPPGWVYAVVWTILDCLMAFAATVVTASGASDKNFSVPGIVAFVSTVTLLGVWGYLMFKLRRGDFALVNFCLVNPAAWLATGLFWRINQVAGACLLPLDVWLAFNFYLNWQTWRLNLPFWRKRLAAEDAAS